MVYKEKVAQFLISKHLSYEEAIRLYKLHPKHRPAMLANFVNRPAWDVMHKRIVYELENLAGLPHSNRAAVPESDMPQLSAAKAARSQATSFAEVPIEVQKFEYLIPTEKLTQEERLAMQDKARLYHYMEKAKAELAKLGTNNDEKTVDARAELVDKIEDFKFRIRAIHEVLKHHYPDTPKPEPSPEALPGFVTQFDEDCEKEFRYMKMDYWQRKDLIVRLRSSVVHWQKRADAARKAKTKRDNLTRLERGKLMIRILSDYFDAVKDNQA
jgi:hypothetical protein